MITALVLYDLPAHIDREACSVSTSCKMYRIFSAYLVSSVNNSFTT